MSSPTVQSQTLEPVAAGPGMQPLPRSAPVARFRSDYASPPKYGLRASPAGSTRICEMPHAQRPRERLLGAGPDALSDAELLAVLLGTGAPGANALRLADDLLTEFGGPDGLSRATPQELARRSGVGPAKALRLVAAFSLARRIGTAPPRAELRCSADIAEVVRPWLAHARRERVVLVVSDGALRLRRAFMVTEGSSDECLLPVREILTAVLQHDGARFAVAHNHPSGLLEPSTADAEVTASLSRAARAVGLEFLGHLIIAGQRWTTCPAVAARSLR